MPTPGLVTFGAMRSRAYYFFAVTLVGAACGGGDLSKPQLNDHAMTGTVAIFASSLSGVPVIEDVELLLDDESAFRQSFSTGVDRAFFNVETTFKTAGTHKVAIRVVRQTRTTVEYFASGGLATYRPSNTSTITSYQFGKNGPYLLKAGERIEMSVEVP